MARQRKEAKQVHHIDEQLVNLATPVGDLVLDPNNARHHDDRSHESIAESYREHGQRKPIIVRRENNVVIAGNGQLAAARSLGWTHIAALFVDDTEAEATRFALRDNRTAELSVWDVDRVADTLQSLREQEVDISNLGWNELELIPYLEIDNAFDPGLPDEGADFSPPDNSGKSPHRLEFTPEQWEDLQKLTKEVAGDHPTMTSERIIAALS